jgi:hypothetical protein
MPTPTVTPQSRPRRRPDVETHVLPDGTCLLFDPRGEEGHTLNAAGALVWDYCDGERSGAETAQELATLLPDHPQAREETAELLAEMAGRGLLVLPPDTPDGAA